VSNCDAAVACGGDAPRESTAERLPKKPMCVMKGVPPPPVKYALLKSMKLAKQTYGGARPQTMKLVEQARGAHADAIVNYSGAQHFGFWPWRFIRPIVSGDAVRIENHEAFDCVRLGGEFYTETAYFGRGTSPAPPGESDYDRGRREERERLERERGGEGR
jgi:hypothetical protein